MIRRSIAAIFAGAFVLAGAVAAFAATQEYDITVPVTLKNLKAALPAGITISCAVGRGNTLAYSTASGGATGATGSGSTHSSLGSPDGKLPPVTDVVVVVAEEQTTLGSLASVGVQYLCWGKLDKGTTPVNFINGNVK
jgi:hypothetical protein